MDDSERRDRAERLLARDKYPRPVWIGDDGWFRIGHTDDMRQMLDDLGIKTSAQ